jgi:DMATS type aromatic prenyltransferase
MSADGDLSVTYHEIARNRLDRLWPALFNEPCPPSAHARLDAMMLPWGLATIPTKPVWPSDIGDDHSPYEFSIAFDPSGPPTLRFLSETQGSTATLNHTREAALALTRRLPNVDLSRFERVRKIFLPEVSSARFALWHATSLSGGAEVKAYFNPQILGKEASFDLVQRALRELGFENVWPSLLHAVQRQTIDDEIRYFSLDLNGGGRARVKVYLYQRGVSADHLERMAATCDGYTPGEVTKFCQSITETTGPYTAFPICTYLSFVEGIAIPTEVTIQIPIRFYADDDLIARDRISQYMESRGMSPAPYQAALEALAPRPLDQGPGLNTYVSLRTGKARLTVYMATELFGKTPPSVTILNRHNQTTTERSPDPG